MVNLFFDYLLEIFKRSLMLSRPLRVFGLTRAETIPRPSCGHQLGILDNGRKPDLAIFYGWMTANAVNPGSFGNYDDIGISPG